MSSYHKLSVAEKRAVTIANHRERSVPCPAGCGMQLMTCDLLAHLKQRCSGRPEPGPTAKYITHAEVLDLGVEAWRLSRWSRPNRKGWVEVRSRVGEDGFRRYLLGDLQLAIADREAFLVGSSKSASEEA